MIGFGICLPILPEHMQELSALNGGVLPSYVRGAGTLHLLVSANVINMNGFRGMQGSSP